MADLKPIFEHEVSPGDDTSADETSKSEAVDIEVVTGTTDDSNINNHDGDINTNDDNNVSSNNDDSNNDNSDNNNDNSGINNDNGNDDSNANEDENSSDKGNATEEDVTAKREDVEADRNNASENKVQEVHDNKTIAQDNIYQVNVINRSESESADDESSDSDDDLTDVSDRFVNDGAHLLKRGLIGLSFVHCPFPLYSSDLFMNIFITTPEQ